MKRRKSKAFLAIVFSAALWPPLIASCCCRFMLKAEHILPLRVVKKLNVFSSKTVVSVCCFSPDFLSLFKGVIKGKGAFL